MCLTDHSLEVSCYRLVNCLIGFCPFLVFPFHSKLLNWGVSDGGVVPFRWVGSKTIHVCRSSDAISVTADIYALQKGCFKSQILHSTWSAATSTVTNGGIIAADILKALIGVVTYIHVKTVNNVICL